MVTCRRGHLYTFAAVCCIRRCPVRIDHLASHRYKCTGRCRYPEHTRHHGSKGLTRTRRRRSRSFRQHSLENICTRTRKLRPCMTHRFGTATIRTPQHRLRSARQKIRSDRYSCRHRSGLYMFRRRRTGLMHTHRGFLGTAPACSQQGTGTGIRTVYPHRFHHFGKG